MYVIKNGLVTFYIPIGCLSKTGEWARLRSRGDNQITIIKDVCGLFYATIEYYLLSTETLSRHFSLIAAN
jgi:hypothetical protein